MAEALGNAALQRVIVGFKLRIGKERSSGNSGIRQSLNYITRGIRDCTIDRADRTGQQGLIEFNAAWRMSGMRTHIAGFQQEVIRKNILNIQVIFLRVGVDNMGRYPGCIRASTGNARLIDRIAGSRRQQRIEGILQRCTGILRAK